MPDAMVSTVEPSSSNIESVKDASENTKLQDQHGQCVYGVRVGDWLSEVPVNLFLQCRQRDLVLEFQMMRHLSEARDSHGRQQELRRTQEHDPAKDRFRNIVPIEKHRVMLPGDGYINASYIKVGDDDHAFIATQSPLTHTISDFWLMVATQRVTTIVTLCQPIEQESSHCAIYWPREEGDVLEFSDLSLQVRLAAVSVLSGFDFITRRDFSITYQGDSWEAVQFQHTAWPDHDALAPELVLPLFDIVNGRRQEDNPCPIVVHCNAGVGRTGCFLGLQKAVSSMRQQYQKNPGAVPKVSIIQQVLQMRMQRPSAVQTSKQYQQIYAYFIALLRRDHIVVDDSASSVATPSTRSGSKHSTELSHDWSPRERHSSQSSIPSIISEVS